MKIKNNTLKGIVDALKSISNRTTDIKLRWELAKLSKPFIESNELLQLEINKIIKEEGKEDDKGNLSLDITNKHYQELMNCDVDIDCCVTLSFLEKYNPTMMELIQLDSIIVERDE